MRRAERVVDVEVAAVGELACEALVVLRLAGVEARVLEHVDAVVAAASSRSRAATGAIAYFARSSSVFGRPRCEQTRTSAAPRSSKQLQRRQRRADAGVVGDPAVLERHVQVGADEDGLARDVGVANRARDAHRSSYAPTAAGSDAPIFATRSTSRQL